METCSGGKYGDHPEIAFPRYDRFRPSDEIKCPACELAETVAELKDKLNESQAKIDELEAKISDD